MPAKTSTTIFGLFSDPIRRLSPHRRIAFHAAAIAQRYDPGSVRVPDFELAAALRAARLRVRNVDMFSPHITSEAIANPKPMTAPKNNSTASISSVARKYPLTNIIAEYRNIFLICIPP